MSGPLHTVHVRVNDAATGQPTPVRIRLFDSEGQSFAPLGRLTEFATGRNQDVGGNVLLGMKPYAYIDGSCEVPLPTGTLQADIHKGLEYRPIQQEFQLTAGKLALRFTLERWIDLSTQGWFSGDTRAHFLTPHAALLEAGAEDLAVVNLLAAPCRIPGPYQRDYPAIPNILAFSGQRPALETPGHLVVVNTHNTHPVVGSLGLLNCHRVVYPLSFGGSDGLDNWSLGDWCDQCHRKGGLVVWTRGWQGKAIKSDSLASPLGETLADLILGKIDAFEIDFFEDSPFDFLPDWYRLLNAGCRVPLVGGSGKDCNGIALGAMRTYAHLPPNAGFTYPHWIEAVRSGRTFVTNGPLISFTVNGCDPGETINLSTEDERLFVRAEARSIVPFDRLEVIVNGNMVAHCDAAGSPLSASFDDKLSVPAGSWLAIRCRGSHLLPQSPAPMRSFAHTSPIYVSMQGKSPRIDAYALEGLLVELDKMLTWVEKEARFESVRQRQHLTDIFQSARQELMRRLNS